MEEHSHHHHHHHGISHDQLDSINKVFIFCIILNLLFVGIEAVVGLIYNSVGLLSDAGHNLSDVFSLFLALFAFKMAKVPPKQGFTYGYRKASILISLLNAILLLVAVGGIIIESIYRLKHPSPISGMAISWTAGAGILINGLTTWLLMKEKEHDLNTRGAYLHMLMDTLVSVGVVLSGVIITYTGWSWIDPVVSLSIAAMILISTTNLLKESLYMSLDAVPSNVHMDQLEAEINKYPEIVSWHHLHVWAMSTTENAATLHIILKDINEMERVKHDLKHTFADFHVGHCTIECETKDSLCKECSHLSETI